MLVKEIGFPVIHNFPGDIREFTPTLFKYLNKYEDLNLYLEEGYGERLGFTKEDYIKENPRIKFVPLDEVYKKDMLVSIKNPDLENLEKLRENSSLFTMIHYDTRPKVVELIKRKGIKSFSMDSVVDDYGLRMFVDYFGTAFCGCEIAFDVLKEIMPNFYSKEREPLRVTILGAGGVAQGCIKSVEVLGDKEFLGKDIPGVIAQVLTRTITDNEEILKEILKKTNILIDATKRRDYSKVIIRNEVLGYLPKDAVILDLSADRYDTSVDPPLVRALEGTVKGSPAHKIIYPNDELYDELPDFVDSTNRRVVVSCDAWPSINPKKSLAYYENMIRDYFNVLLTKDLNHISEESDNIFERALYRSTIEHFEKINK